MKENCSIFGSTKQIANIPTKYRIPDYIAREIEGDRPFTSKIYFYLAVILGIVTANLFCSVLIWLNLA